VCKDTNYTNEKNSKSQTPNNKQILNSKHQILNKFSTCTVGEKISILGVPVQRVMKERGKIVGIRRMLRSKKWKNYFNV